MSDTVDPTEVYQQQIDAGKSHVYAEAYSSKIDEGPVFARHFAEIRERRYHEKQKKANEANGNKTVEPTDHDMRRRTPQDFIFLKQLGEGAYSTVLLVTEKGTKTQFAMKILEKSHIKKEKKTKYVMTEKEVFNALSHPFIVKLYYTFQDAQKLYFCLSYCQNGELLHWIKKLGSFDLECTRFYAAEIICALEHMHLKGIIHRDLKPENILLDGKMHVQITDFGTAKILDEADEGHANSFVGTAQYVSPELLSQKKACKSSDIWALGCIVYQLLSGKVPFRGGNEYQTFKKITALDYDFPEGFPEIGKDLVTQMLKLDPNDRLGAKSFDELKNHPFFEGIKFDDLHVTDPPKLEAYLPARGPDESPLHAHDPTDEEVSLYIDQAPHVEVKAKQSKERAALLKKQKDESPWNRFLNPDELILKTGLVDKRKGLFAKRRQLILTDGPRIIYIDPDAMEMKGEIPWSDELFPQFKNMRTFFIHTPLRTYYLEDVERTSISWVDTIQQLLRMQKVS